MKTISEVLAMLLMIVIVVGLIGVAYYFISGMASRQMAGVIQTTYSTCVAGSRIEILATNGGTTIIPAGDIRVFVGGNLITARDITDMDKSASLTNIDPGQSFWILINDVGGGNRPQAGRTYRGQIVYAGKAVDFIVTC